MNDMKKDRLKFRTIGAYMSVVYVLIGLLTVAAFLRLDDWIRFAADSFICRFISYCHPYGYRFLSFTRKQNSHRYIRWDIRLLQEASGRSYCVESGYLRWCTFVQRKRFANA